VFVVHRLRTGQLNLTGLCIVPAKAVRSEVLTSVAMAISVIWDDIYRLVRGVCYLHPLLGSTKARRQGAEHIAGLAYLRDGYILYVGKPLGWPKCGWEDIKMYPENWFELTQDKVLWQTFVT
jgi:hypothetical protein